MVCKDLCRLLGSKSAVAVLAGLLLIAVPGWAQVGANVGGVVTDNTGAVVPEATVTITNTSNGTSQVIKASGQGTYRAVNLAPAPYRSLQKSVVLDKQEERDAAGGIRRDRRFLAGRRRRLGDGDGTPAKRLRWSKPPNRRPSR